ncbi:hypothetical protein C5D44_13310 [Rathayibacter sp. AY1B5]|nr:hypothetical protein C5D44_13310 [Rathayibacter sp. AY1B5]
MPLESEHRLRVAPQDAPDLGQPEAEVGQQQASRATSCRVHSCSTARSVSPSPGTPAAREATVRVDAASRSRARIR